MTGRSRGVSSSDQDLKFLSCFILVFALSVGQLSRDLLHIFLEVNSPVKTYIPSPRRNTQEIMVLVDELHVFAYMPTKLWNKQEKLILYDTPKSPVDGQDSTFMPHLGNIASEYTASLGDCTPPPRGQPSGWGEGYKGV